MAERAPRRMTADEFLAWHEGQEQRYELIDGVPVAMAGARRQHDQVVVNALIAIGRHLQAGQCRPFTSDTAVRISDYQVRYPDLGLDCGTFRADAFAADAPRLVIEVLCESTRAFDFVGKLEEYKSVPSLCHIVLVDADEPKVIHWVRAASGAWTYRTLEGSEAVLEVADLGLSLSIAALYAGLTFRPRPRLVAAEPPNTGENG